MFNPHVVIVLTDAPTRDAVAAYMQNFDWVKSTIAATTREVAEQLRAADLIISDEDTTLDAFEQLGEDAPMKQFAMYGGDAVAAIRESMKASSLDPENISFHDSRTTGVDEIVLAHFSKGAAARKALPWAKQMAATLG